MLFLCEHALKMPPKNDSMKRVFAYLLMTRGIDKSVLQEFVRQNMVYESADYHNAVFVGYDETGTPRHANMRGTGTKNPFKCNAVGSQLGIRNLYHLIVERPNGCEKNADTLDISLKASELYQIPRRKRLCHKQNNSADKIAQRVLERKARRYSRGADCGNNRVDLYADIRQRDKHDYRIQRDLDKRKGEGLYRVIYLCFEQDFFDRNKYQLDRDYTDGNNYQKDQKL